MNAPTETSTAPNGARKKALLGVTALVALGAIAYGGYWALVLNHYESTDNAYVQGHVVQITPQLGGTVVAVQVDDTQAVKAGQVLVKLDPADAQVALDQAEAQLAQTVREARTLYANNGTLKSQITLRQADLTRAQGELVRAQDDVTRRVPLAASGAIGKEELVHAQAQVDTLKAGLAAAQSAVTAAQDQLQSNQTLTDGVPVTQHPSVLRAAARVREAYLALQRATLLAPVDGVVAKRTVQLGQRVAAGTPMLSVIALDQLWVEANFKEGQLRSLRQNQPVELTADVYGRKTVFHGQVSGLGAGTGAAFALLPAQNATGNWIKVVQRVPVRITLDPKELAAHPLRVGLSMEARVDVSRDDGAVLADHLTQPAAAKPPLLASDSSAADAAVKRIVAANLGRGNAAR